MKQNHFVPIHGHSKRIKEQKKKSEKISTTSLQNSVIYSFQNIENFMKDVYKDRYGEDISDDSVKKLYSVAVSIFAIGGMLGGFSGGIIANRFGRFVPSTLLQFSFRTCNLARAFYACQTYLSILKIRIARKRVCMYCTYVRSGNRTIRTIVFLYHSYIFFLSLSFHSWTERGAYC